VVRGSVGSVAIAISIGATEGIGNAIKVIIWIAFPGNAG
jgi:hypothetical protein